jgi:hypothetical protein
MAPQTAIMRLLYASLRERILLPLLDEGREKAWFTAYFISGFARIKGTIYVSDKA